jgi:hypothetical protein
VPTASEGKCRVPGATVETTKLRTSQAAELIAKLADTEYTAAIDPLTPIPGKPDIPEPSPEGLKPFLGRWSPHGPEKSNYESGWRD